MAVTNSPLLSIMYAESFWSGFEVLNLSNFKKIQLIALGEFA